VRTPIQALSAETVNRIAAGEVIERPAAALKELLENALDAGADQVEVEIAGGGVSLLRLSDNGIGIPREELQEALSRHSTSKIRALDDIEGVSSFGFRGEALASMASVSDLSLTSRTEEEESAWSIRSFHGKLEEPRPQARETGCTVVMKDLFAQIPVRKKFLKSENSEKRAILQIFQQYVLAHPEIAFRFLEDGKEKLQYPECRTIRERAEAVLGREALRHMVDLEGEDESYRLTGLCSLPLSSRGNRSQQYVFLGRRPIRDDSLRHAISQAYRDVLPPGRFPSCVLFLELPGEEVDVNVHPSKREVRFRNPSRLHSLFTRALKQAIGSGGDLASRLREKESLLLGPERLPGGRKQSALSFPGHSHSGYQAPARPTPPMDLRETGDSAPERSEERSFWHLQNTFILTRIGGGLVIIDQHNAHERVLFDQALANLSGLAPKQQELLFPHKLELSPPEMEAWREGSEFFQEIGYRMSEFGPSTLLVEAIPETVSRWDEGSAIRDILHDISEETGDLGKKRETALATYSCKNAIKAGEAMRDEEMDILVTRLFQTTQPYTCPHGRPIIIRIGREELEKRFHRKIPDSVSEKK
jgi:DNA mismatch repair protein MutL